ncbi:MAG: D-alanyl-D-alanine carboxypeptidase [Paracoccaceae bacterium]|nr:D-alanyl-D-alanine carboxypeptidase [Paracoccaceae bacterium]MDE3122345.1 D-alanyl-D-alanine carboxypeptidase [Paracoccaceae bacterium]MDE3240518.1 D-alanyl-D-alanine carboxypeptidase [Paracoccaceae bacterium]
MKPRLLTALALIAATGLALPAQAFDTMASAAYVVDVTSGTVLLNKNGDTPMPPASMSKLMTLDLLFRALKSGQVTLQTRFAVSPEAKAMGGSTMFLNTRDRPTVDQLIQGIIVLSGNDACVTVAEGLAGTQAAFVEQMNAEAKRIGLTNSHFANASGWPDPGQLMSMHDLATLAMHIMDTYPEYYHYFGIKSFAFDGRAPANENNRDPLLGRVPGADGMKTGHTEASGYGLVGTAKRGDRRVLVVLNGLPTMASRGTEGEKLINWGFGQFGERIVLQKDSVVATAPVWMGAANRVNLIAPKTEKVLLPVTTGATLDAKVVFTGPIKAPIKAGEQVAEMIVTRPGLSDARIPLVAGADVPRGGFVTRVTTAARVLYAKLQGAAARQ